MTIRDGIANIDTPDGPMDVFIAISDPEDASPCVIIYMDVFGLRDELFVIARAFAAEGFDAVVPDLFHRSPVSRFLPANGRDECASLEALEANRSTTLAMSRTDTCTLIDWLDSAAVGHRPTNYFAVGYCMGGRHALAATAAFPDRLRGGMSVHGGRLVTEGPDSPHHLIADLRAPFHFACARDDPACPQDHQEILQAAESIHGACVSYEMHDAHHGWSFPARWSHDPVTAAHIHRLACSMIRGEADDLDQ